MFFIINNCSFDKESWSIMCVYQFVFLDDLVNVSFTVLNMLTLLIAVYNDQVLLYKKVFYKIDEFQYVRYFVQYFDSYA